MFFTFAGRAEEYVFAFAGDAGRVLGFAARYARQIAANAEDAP